MSRLDTSKIDTGPDAEIKKHLLALEDAAMERWREGDPFGWIEISAPQVTYFDPSLEAPVIGREALTAYYAKLAGTIFYQGSEYLEPRVQVHGDTAVLSYRYLSTKHDRKTNETSRTRWNCTEVFAYMDGQWKIIHTHWSYVGGRKPEEA
jgi:ketosteroid isomerase-like protein